MRLERLTFDAGLNEYRAQTEQLRAAHQAGDPEARRILEDGDAQLALARWYDFQDWRVLEAYVESVTIPGSPVRRFEAAVEAVTGGETQALESLLREDPELIRARSSRTTRLDPPRHRATLLHYVAANGVEGYRQKTPPNAVSVARMLLESGADPDALADMYGGRHTTLDMLVSSTPPAEAGVQIPLLETLLDFGASLEPAGTPYWGSPLMTALAFGFRGAAEVLVRRGARVSGIAAAAGLGWFDVAQRLLPGSTPEIRHRALALAAQHGHSDIVRMLLDAGEDPDRYNPAGAHAHSTPLHQAALAGHIEVVRLLVERGARLDIRDTVYHGTPLDWAIHGRQPETERYILSRGT